MNLAKRSRYYQGNIDLDKISKGEDTKDKIKNRKEVIVTY